MVAGRKPLSRGPPGSRRNRCRLTFDPARPDTEVSLPSLSGSSRALWEIIREIGEPFGRENAVWSPERRHTSGWARRVRISRSGLGVRGFVVTRPVVVRRLVNEVGVRRGSFERCGAALVSLALARIRTLKIMGVIIAMVAEGIKDRDGGV